MRILITGCSDQSLWYSAHVGDIFPSLENDENERMEYKTRTPAGYLNFVKARDCVLMEDEND